MILLFSRVWIRLINLHLLFDACPTHSALRASGIGRIKIQCACIGFVLFHSKNAHLLNSNQLTDTRPCAAGLISSSLLPLASNWCISNVSVCSKLASSPPATVVICNNNRRILEQGQWSWIIYYLLQILEHGLLFIYVTRYSALITVEIPGYYFLH